MRSRGRHKNDEGWMAASLKASIVKCRIRMSLLQPTAPLHELWPSKAVVNRRHRGFPPRGRIFSCC